MIAGEVMEVVDEEEEDIQTEGGTTSSTPGWLGKPLNLRDPKDLKGPVFKSPEPPAPSSTSHAAAAGVAGIGGKVSLLGGGVGVGVDATSPYVFVKWEEWERMQREKEELRGKLAAFKQNASSSVEVGTCPAPQGGQGLPVTTPNQKSKADEKSDDSIVVEEGPKQQGRDKVKGKKKGIVPQGAAGPSTSTTEKKIPVSVPGRILKLRSVMTSSPSSSMQSPPQLPESLLSPDSSVVSTASKKKRKATAAAAVGGEMLEGKESGARPPPRKTPKTIKKKDRALN